MWLCTFVLPQEENKCPGAEENGVSILHGNALAFVKVLFSNIFVSLDQLLTIQCVDGKIRNSAPLSVWQYHEGLSNCHPAKHWRFLHSAVCIPIAFADNIEPIRMGLIPAKSHWYADYGGGYSTTTPLQWIPPLIGRQPYTHTSRPMQEK